INPAFLSILRTMQISQDRLKTLAGTAGSRNRIPEDRPDQPLIPKQATPKWMSRSASSTNRAALWGSFAVAEDTDRLGSAVPFETVVLSWCSRPLSSADGALYSFNGLIWWN